MLITLCDPDGITSYVSLVIYTITGTCMFSVHRFDVIVIIVKLSHVCMCESVLELLKCVVEVQSLMEQNSSVAYWKKKKVNVIVNSHMCIVIII